MKYKYFFLLPADHDDEVRNRFEPREATRKRKLRFINHFAREKGKLPFQEKSEHSWKRDEESEWGAKLSNITPEGKRPPQFNLGMRLNKELLLPHVLIRSVSLPAYSTH
ncbi:hypothetical protein CDAR_252441 [Caerostris darwini]|uniref:Uncharacterized protein n=1 Tax=Caerostris darwini TaxID=1538125 RepID=A0AAV4WHJ0_9ARAC|nr:hypothetical protein CDAR_252441 [Caerostris darwini]